MSERNSEVKNAIGRIAAGQTLTRDESIALFDRITSGEATPAQLGALLMGLRMRGETVAEITGAAVALRAKMRTVEAPAEAIDVVGTGGDFSGSFNISTCAAFIVAGAGVPVAKHGNRALSSRCGAADVLTELGVSVGLEPEHVSRCVSEAGIGFMFAPAHHPALANVGPARVELGTRTVFNVLGPLLNPAGVRRHLVGVFAREWAEPLARVLGELGSTRALVVHSNDGMDEITASGPTFVASLENGTVRTYEIGPADVGLTATAPQSLVGGDAEVNAAALRGVLKGQPGPYRDAAAFNAAAALTVAGVAADLRTAMTVATEAIDSGAAVAALDRLIAVSNA